MNIAICAILALLFNTGLWAGESEAQKEPVIVLEMPKKEFKPFAPVRVQLSGGMPGTRAPDGRKFLVSYGYTEFAGILNASVTATVDIMEIPTWLSRRLTKDERAKLDAEQVKLLEELDAELDVLIPLARTRTKLCDAVIAAETALKSLRESQNRVLEKAFKANDRAALSQQASAIRAARMDAAKEAHKNACVAFDRWEDSPEAAGYQFSGAKVRSIWANALAKYPAVKEVK
jgi:hypothetical protein